MKNTILLFCSILLYQLSMAQQVSIPSIIKGVTVMVAFQGAPMNDPIQEVDDLMNKQNYTGNEQIGSVRDYFYTQTSGKVTITSTVVKVTLSKSFGYYETNKLNYVDEAIDLVNQNYPNGFLNLTPDPVDGKLLHINFISRATGRSSTNGASAGKFIKNNTTSQIEVGQGNMTFLGSSSLNINTICHEMGHSVMGWTDYYATAFSNLGNYCVMASAGTNNAPMPINPALRMQRHWIDNVISVSGTTTQTYTLTANSYTTIHKYTNPNNPKEYLLFNAYKIDGYYQSIMGTNTPEGLAIWYVDEETGYDAPLNPNDDNQYFIRLVQADNKDEMHDEFLVPSDVRGDFEDLYGSVNKSFPNGTPFRWKDGGEFGININNISSPGATMQFTVTARPNTIVASSDINGNISPKGTLSVANGQSKTFNFTPNLGYEIDQVKVNGFVVATANPFVLSGISGTKTVSVTFKRKATQAALPTPWQKAAIGSVNSSDFVANTGNAYYLETYSDAVGNGADNFTYLYQPINGDGTFIVHLANYNTVQNQRVGLMIRESLEPNATFAAITKTNMNGAITIQRSSAGAGTIENPNKLNDLHLYELHNWLKIERTGDQIKSYVSRDGSNWVKIENQTISMSSKAYVGFFAKGNGYTTYPTKVLFDNITITSTPFPTVSITSPTTGTSYTSNSVTITAIAAPSVATGSITKVDFYDNTTLIGSDNTAPYSFVWNNVSGGIHAIVAKTTDNTGKVAVSSKVITTTPCNSAGTKITGTVIGTMGSWNNSGNTRDKAFDGDVNTFFDANESVAWTGLSLSNYYNVTNIRYVPRQDLASRMVGGKFQGSTSEDFSNYTDLATVVAAPTSGWNCFDVSSTVAFKYIRYIGPEGAVGNVAEIEFYGTIQTINIAPTVTLTNPVSGSNYAAPANITLTATAADTDGTIARVDFYRGSTLLGSDNTAPYSFVVNGITASVNTFTAVAFDDKGASAVHTVNNVAILANAAPTVSLTSPVSNSNFTAPATISLSATASDANGSIWKVEFYNGSTLIGTDYNAPYEYTLFSLSAGTYSIIAIAFDDAGLASQPSISQVNVIANPAPTITITSPTASAAFIAPATINITADAADANGTVSKVEFFSGSTLIGTDFTAPYSYTWSNVGVGNYSITAKATDNAGAYTYSTIMGVPVTASTATITGPACANNNTTITYELSAAKRANATSYGWYFTGSTQSFIPSGYHTTLNTGNYYNTGQLCVGVSYSNAPYTTYCITIPKCNSAREGNTEEWSEVFVETKSIVYPNPFTGETTIHLANNAQMATIHVYNAQGILVEATTASGTYTFGQNVASGMYVVKINIDNKIETLKLVKE